MKATILLQIEAHQGAKRFRPALAQDIDTQRDFLSRIDKGVEIVYVRATYETVTGDYVTMYKRRAHYWAYIHTIIDKGFESWTNQFVGRNKDEKAEFVHMQLKMSYCSVYQCPMFSISDDNMKQKIKKGDLEITYEEATKRMEWMINRLSEMHEEVTLKQTGTAWKINPWSD